MHDTDQPGQRKADERTVHRTAATMFTTELQKRSSNLKIWLVISKLNRLFLLACLRRIGLLTRRGSSDACAQGVRPFF